MLKYFKCVNTSRLKAAALCGMTVKTKLKEVNIGEEVPKEKEPIKRSAVRANAHVGSLSQVSSESEYSVELSVVQLNL